MKITDTIAKADGTIEQREIEVPEDYFETPALDPEVDPITDLQRQVSDLQAVIAALLTGEEPTP